MKFYAISTGRKTGIFTKQQEYTQYTANFSGVCAKAFSTKREALIWLNNKKEAGLLSTTPMKTLSTHTMSKRYYAISHGRKTGIFTNAACYYSYTQGFKGARAKSFHSYQAAKSWLHQEHACHTAFTKDTSSLYFHSSAQKKALQQRICLSHKVKNHISTLDARRVFALDIELTSLLSTAEILQVSIVNGLGQVLFNNYFRPETVTSWDETITIHHITPSMVANKPTFHTAVSTLTQLFANAQLIIGYSTMQDIGHLHKFGVQFPHAPIYFDAGDAYSFVHMNTLHPRTYAKLKTCAAYYGYTDENWHNSLADTHATLYCFYAMLNDRNALFRLLSF